MSATAENDLLGKAPKKRTLKGDPKSPESAEHIIEFPGGAISVTRTSDGEYWAHIIVNQGQVVDGTKGLRSAVGMVVLGRVTRKGRHVRRIEDFETIEHIAIRIRTVTP